MRVKTGLAVAVFLIIVAACDSEEPTSTFTVGTPTLEPDAQATIIAQAMAPKGGTPTPTTIPAEEREVVLKFAQGHATISRDWESFHADFDNWREGLGACDASTLQVTLRQFAGQFAAITEAARALPRFLAVRNLADTLIDASEREEAAIRRLRDEWRPDDPTVFEDVHSQRSAASAIQKQVQDQLGDLRDPSFRERVSAYASEVQSLNFRWDGLHRTYDEIRLQDAAFDPAAPDSVSALGGLIDLFRESIIEPIRALPASGDTAQMSRNIASLAETAEAEDLALRRLTGTLSGIPTDLRDLTLYGAFDDQLVSTNATRRLAVQELGDILANTSQENKDDVQTFANEYDLLVRSLNTFHNGYDDWRESEGGCDRAKSVKTLGQLTLDFGKLTTFVRGLPNAIFLRPLAELLVEAAEREEQALRDLRNNWRPFDADVYSAADRERIAAQKLRRQVDAGGQDILPRFKISQQDVTP